MNRATYVTSAALLSLSFGCSTVSDQQKLRWMETTPVCFSKPDCDAKWAASREWMQKNFGHKIQIDSDDLIQTYDPEPYDAHLAASVSRNAVSVTKGEQSYAIKIRARCANKFGCVQSVDDYILGFNENVSNAASNDPACYIDMLENDKPQLGLNPMWSKETNRYVVKRVCSGSPAEKAGLRPNDILLKIGNTDHVAEGSLTNDFKFGETVTLEILRGDARQVLTATCATQEEILALKPQLVRDKIRREHILMAEERLNSLSRKLQKGLITQQEYDAIKKDLLEEK